MSETSYIKLACQVMGIDPSTVLKSREEEDSVVIINSAGQKFRFSFEYLEDFKQYLEDNRPKTAAKTRKTTPAAKKNRSRRRRSRAVSEGQRPRNTSL